MMNAPRQRTDVPAVGYPESASERTRWIEALRADAAPKSVLDHWKPYEFLQETEIGPAGEELDTATILLTNRECPYRCLMCDLWTNTLDETVQFGAIAAQIRFALQQMDRFRPGAAMSPAARSQVKLYNAGSFFDPRAIPPGDYPEIAAAVEGFGRVVVECHPALVGDRAQALKRLLTGKLEVAIGLETAHAPTLDRLNKRFTLDDFQRAARFLADNGMDLRVFLLLRPPFMSEQEGLDWAKRSIDYAFDAGATACTLIPTRGGNGAMERLASQGLFAPPSIASLEAALEYGITLGRGRVFADLWKIDALVTSGCSAERVRRLEVMNWTQTVVPE
jgi:radical SAM enzyme (TIGR01210 family)